MHGGAGLSAVELRRGSMVIPKHDAVAAACVSSELRLLRIHFVIGEKSLALGAALRNTQLFSTFTARCPFATAHGRFAGPEPSLVNHPSMTRDGRTDL